MNPGPAPDMMSTIFQSMSSSTKASKLNRGMLQSFNAEYIKITELRTFCVAVKYRGVEDKNSGKKYSKNCLC